jgi:hypothetical protein
MSPLPEISNEQKLTYIYHALKDQEARRKRAMVYRLFKWLILVVIVYLLVTYPAQIFGKISELIRPVIIEQSQTLLEENRNSINKNLNLFFRNIKSILDENLVTDGSSTATSVQSPKSTPATLTDLPQLSTQAVPVKTSPQKNPIPSKNT